MKTVSIVRSGSRRNTRRAVGGALVGLGLISTVFAACAKGNTIDDSGAGGAGGAGGGQGGSAPAASTSSSSSGIMPGQVGGPCTADTDCASGMCTPVGPNKFCTTPCPPACPAGTYCSFIGGASVCIPDLDQQCAKCKAAADCKMPSDECFKAPLGDSFCARDCTPQGMCPNGFTCVDKPTYTGGGGGADGGAPDAGKDSGGDAGKDGAADAGDAGKPGTVPAKWCVPNSGLSCPCDPKRDGIVHDCHVKNNFGDCSGKETCDGTKAMWQGCSAATPAAETCNIKDDNCDGMIDEGDPNGLCMSLGPKPPHANYVCTAGMCLLGKCDPGWAAFPPGLPSAGCPCQVEAGEPNGTCATVTPAGSVSDTGGAVALTGTLSAANDVDFWSFDTVDTNQGSTNSYHVSIKFTAPTPNNEFLMDVIRGAPCVDSPVGAGTAITSYDWGVNGQSGTEGEAPCAAAVAGQPHCANHSAPYFVRVYRKGGATATCTQYSIAVTAMAGASDFSMKCP